MTAPGAAPRPSLKSSMTTGPPTCATRAPQGPERRPPMRPRRPPSLVLELAEDSLTVTPTAALPPKSP